MATAKNIPDLKQRLVSAAPVEDDSSFELKLRPQRLAEFIGQPKVKENLAVAIEAARSRGEALDHVLLYGPPGLGKTTLATIIANELAVPFQQTSGPTLQIKGDLTAILTNVRDKQVLFIDEVHRLQPALEEILYSALEDYKLDIMIGQGPVRAHPHHGREAVHLHRRDHARRTAFVAAAFAFRHRPAAGVLYPRRLAHHRGTLGRDSWRRDRRRRRARNCQPLPRELRESPTVCCAGCAIMPRCAGAGKDRSCRPRRPRCRCWKSTATASTKWTASCC